MAIEWGAAAAGVLGIAAKLIDVARNRGKPPGDPQLLISQREFNEYLKKEIEGLKARHAECEEKHAAMEVRQRATEILLAKAMTWLQVEGVELDDAGNLRRRGEEGETRGDGE